MKKVEVKDNDKVEGRKTNFDYSKRYFIFQFKDGETAKYRMDKDCHNLQQFLDRMNHFHELEKENKRLQEQLREANDLIMWVVRTIPTGNKDEDDFDRYIEKWGVK